MRYAKTVDDVNIAYQVRGDGPVDLVYTLGMAGNFEIEFEAPVGNSVSRAAEAFSRVILFDKRGTGLSDRVLGAPDFDMRADDLRAVLDGAGSERAVLVGNRGGGSLAAFFAAMHPDRVLALVLYNSWARTAWAPDYPVGASRDDLAAWRRDIAGTLGNAQTGKPVPPERRARPCGTIPTGSGGKRDLFDTEPRPLQRSRSTSSSRRSTSGASCTPSRRRPSSSRAPRLPGHGLSISPKGFPAPGSFTCPARTGCPTPGMSTSSLGEVERFVQSVHAEEATFERILTTVLFTDIVGSTEKAARSAIARGRPSWNGTTPTVRAMIGRYRGSEVDTAGDGFFATFDGPARAVRCGQAIVEAVQPLGLAVPSGCPHRRGRAHRRQGRRDRGHIGARVAARAQARARCWSRRRSRISPSGSGLVFEDAGEYELKGVPGEWRLYRLVAGH